METIIGLSSGSVALLAGSSILRSNGHLPWFYTSPLVLLGITVIYGVSFVGLLINFYEGYLHYPYPQSYTKFKYSLIQGLGFGALACFSSAYLWLAFSLGNQ